MKKKIYHIIRKICYWILSKIDPQFNTAYNVVKFETHQRKIQIIQAACHFYQSESNEVRQRWLARTLAENLIKINAIQIEEQIIQGQPYNPSSIILITAKLEFLMPLQKQP